MTKHFEHGGLRRRSVIHLFVALVIVLVASSIAAAVFSIYHDRKMVEFGAKQIIKNTSLFMEAQATPWLEESNTTITGIAIDYAQGSDDTPEAALAKLRRAMRYDSVSKYIYIERGSTFWIVDRLGREIENPALVKALMGYVAIGDGPLGHTIKSGDLSFLPMVVTNRDSRGQLFSVGSLVGIDALLDIYEATGRQGEKTSLIGSDGSILVRFPGIHNYAGKVLGVEPHFLAFAQAHRAGFVSGKTVSGNVSIQAYFTPSRKFDFLAMASLTDESIAASLRERIRATVIMIGLVLFIIILVAAVLYRMIRALTKSEEFHQELMRNASDALLIIDRDGRIVTCNPYAIDVYGALDEAQLVGCRWNELAPASQPNQRLSSEYARDVEAEARLGGSAAFEWTCQKLHGDETFTCSVHFSRLGGHGQGALLAVMRDITEQKRHLATQEYLASHDALTGLPNRYAFGQAVEARIAEMPDRPIAIMLVDLNRFKEVNDTLGHHRGDEVLQQLATRLQHWLRQRNAEIARLGGDELVIMLPEAVDKDYICTICEGLLARMKLPIEIENMQLELTASIGIALYPEDGREPTALLRCADIAMYKAKHEQSGFQFYHQSGDHFTADRLSLQTELAKAVRDELLHLNFQPKLRLSDHSVVGVEALVRWTHPERGAISPAAFIPLIESTELIHDLTRWVLDAALRQMRQWLDNGLNITVAVNISTQNLRDAGFVDSIADALSRYDIPPHMLEVEITESAFIDDPELALQRLEGIRALGVSLSIDDFGTGYSSLAYLKRLPIQSLKIDKMFVDSMESVVPDTRIMDVSLMLARNFGLRSIAEGVETDDAVKRLEGLGCDIVQGYVFGRPMTAEVFALWYHRHISSLAAKITL